MSQEAKTERWWEKELIKSQFKWREPEGFVRLIDEYERSRSRLTQPILVALVFVLFIAPWFLPPHSDQKRPSFEVAVIIAFGGAVFLAYGVPKLIRMCPSEVTVRKGFMFRTRGNHAQLKQLESFCWIPMREWLVLRLKLKSGKYSSIGVPLGFQREQLDSFLQERGLRKGPDAHWTDFSDLAFLRDASN